MAYLLIVFASALVLILVTHVFLSTQASIPPVITCIMVTGKDKGREQFARQAVRNFMEQTYPKKQLLVLHHGSFEIEKAPGISVVHVTKNAVTTLGDIRNMGLDRVALGGLWAVWDDDDYRRPDYLETLYGWLVQSGAALATYTCRLEHNQNTGLTWKSEIPWGSVHVLAKRVAGVRYLSKDTMEDVDLIADYKKQGHRVVVKNNFSDPSLYVRLVHTTNTSLYVDAGKNNIIYSTVKGGYQEHKATEHDIEYVNQKRNAFSLGMGSI